MLRRIIWLGELYLWEKREWRIAVKPFEALSTLLDVKTALKVESWDFPGGSAGKESACNVGDLGFDP